MNRPRPGASVRQRWQALPQRRRLFVLIVLAALALSMLGVMVFRDALGRWLWPDPRYDALRQRAELALRDGRLTAADGSGARELFEAALALQPDQLDAREGMQRVALAALARAERFTRDGRLAQAQSALRLARELQAPAARADALDVRLHALQAPIVDVDALLARAQAVLAGGHLDDGPDAALPLYRQVLQVRPRNQRALEGREDALEALLKPAEMALARGELMQVSALLERAQAFDPGFPALPALRDGLAQALARRERQIHRLLAHGQVERAARECQDIDGIEGAAQTGVCGAALGDAVLVAANARIADFRFGEADRLLSMARTAGVAADRLQQVQAHLRQARRSAGRLPPVATPHTRAQLANALALADQAQRRGHWLTPPGESAWDRLREARALAPHDPKVRQASDAMLVAARDCQRRALRDNALGHALECLDAWRLLAPTDAGLLPAQRRLAERWLAVGDERLRGGDVRGAREALARARQVDAGVPGIDALAQRLAHIGPGLN